jgi:hypothetical protein
MSWHAGDEGTARKVVGKDGATMIKKINKHLDAQMEKFSLSWLLLKTAISLLFLGLLIAFVLTFLGVLLDKSLLLTGLFLDIFGVIFATYELFIYPESIKYREVGGRQIDHKPYLNFKRRHLLIGFSCILVGFILQLFSAALNIHIHKKNIYECISPDKKNVMVFTETGWFQWKECRADGGVLENDISKESCEAHIRVAVAKHNYACKKAGWQVAE